MGGLHKSSHLFQLLSKSNAMHLTGQYIYVSSYLMVTNKTDAQYFQIAHKRGVEVNRWYDF